MTEKITYRNPRSSEKCSGSYISLCLVPGENKCKIVSEIENSISKGKIR